ncbi:hypothetical protein MN608_06388 [Microdochium nivale]|nr:hypothetical protein MN608_06388 [Microdochium nivale]
MNTTDICAIPEAGRVQNTTGVTGIGVLVFFLITASIIFFLAIASNGAKICRDLSVLLAIRPVLSTICDAPMILGICLQAYGLVNGHRL